MAPRSARVLLEESPAPAPSPNLGSSAFKPRRSVSDAGGRSSRGDKSATSPKPFSSADQWFVRFTDVTVRCHRTGQTDIPGGFSRQKERQGKQGKVKKGKLRNLYRFVRIERWEMRGVDGAGMVSMEDIHRMRSGGGEGSLREGSEGEEDGVQAREDGSEEEEDDDAESRMSFHYEGDEAQPVAGVAPRNFKSDARSPTPVARAGARSAGTQRSASASASTSGHGHGRAGGATSAAAGKMGVYPPIRDDAKFGNRLRDDSLGLGGRRTKSPTLRAETGATSPAGRGGSRFDRPTVASLAKAVGGGGGPGSVGMTKGRTTDGVVGVGMGLPPRPGTPGPGSSGMGRRAMSLGAEEGRERDKGEGVPFPKG